jgi:hypothetical protein
VGGRPALLPAAAPACGCSRLWLLPLAASQSPTPQDAAPCHVLPSALPSVPQEIERYKQAFGRPGTPTAAVNYYRSLVDANSRRPIPQLNQ